MSKAAFVSLVFLMLLPMSASAQYDSVIATPEASSASYDATPGSGGGYDGVVAGGGASGTGADIYDQSQDFSSYIGDSGLTPTEQEHRQQEITQKHNLERVQRINAERRARVEQAEQEKQQEERLQNGITPPE